ncbi:MAG: hypothetical protein ABI870_11575 [Rhodanobacter sp.]
MPLLVNPEYPGSSRAFLVFILVAGLVFFSAPEFLILVFKAQASGRLVSSEALFASCITPIGGTVLAAFAWLVAAPLTKKRVAGRDPD